ncbi:general transcription factor II-I repeat domain-containing protein 2-like [Nerophis ophidion]|uniref:general transcription factor II-I repeat domain-containing protein 2-like n=1 Tax=Nerophis ophidion TaxID=159077 RepID=UPI002AE03687|nr:general transcription factor II-I repeat domain-containing protein 2-like [Nerophis ophidion]
MFESKEKEEMTAKINQIPLSDATATRRTEILPGDLSKQLCDGIKNAECISLAVDESTDTTENAQLLVFVRYYDEEKGEFIEDVLGLANLSGQTRREDIYKAISEMLNEKGIDLKKVVSIATDGAPAMLGREKGLVPRLREHHPGLLSYHCIIHQSVLCASLGEVYSEIMTTMMKLINFLRASSALQHHLLRTFLTEVDAAFDDLLVHNNVRWLSKGRVLERFWAIREELQVFLSQQNSAKAKQFLEFLQNAGKMEAVAFLADITSHLNDLNLKLQGKKNTVCALMSEVRAFQRNLELFKRDIQEELLHFPKLLELTKGEGDHQCHLEFLEKLIANFKTRFDGFILGKQVLLFIENPFLIRNVSAFSAEAKQVFPWARAASLQTELIDLQESVALKEAQCEAITFWSKLVIPSKFPLLHKMACHILTMFGSTYSCESAFSTMNIVKNKYRSRLTNEHLDQCLRLAITPFVLMFKVLASTTRA